MKTIDRQGDDLRRYDSRLAQFIGDPAHDRSLADEDAVTLADMADAIAAAVLVWAGIAQRLQLRRAAPLDQLRAGRLIIECVFDELLDGDSLGVLDASFSLAVTRP